MSWNQPTEKSSTTTKGNGLLKFLWIALVLCLCIGLGVSLMMVLKSDHLDKAENSAPEKRTPIAQAKTIHVPKADDVRKKTTEMTVEEKIKHFHDLYGEKLPRNIQQVVYYLKNPPTKTFRPPKQKYDIFKHSSEKAIAAMLMVEPGSWLMRAPKYGPSFDKDLAQALKEEIKIEKTDTDEQRELKQAVIESKAELAERIKSGEKASSVLNEMGETYYKLGLYKRDLEDQLRIIRKDETNSDNDVKDAVDAINLMLKDKGIAPIKMPNAVLRKASLRLAAAKAKAESIRKDEK